MRIDKEQFVSDLQSRLSANTRAVIDIVSDLSVDQLNWQPDTKSWSLGQILQHLVKVEQEYTAVLKPVIERASETDSETVNRTPWGRFIVWAVGPRCKLKMPAPRRFVSESGIDAQTMESFSVSQQQLEAHLSQAKGISLDSERFASPESALVQMTLADALAMQVAHQERHIINQMRQLRNRPDFGQ